MCWAAKTDEMVTDGNPMVIGHPRERKRETRVKNQKCLGYVESEEQIGVTMVPLARTSGTSTRVPLSSDCDHPCAGNERAPPFSSAIRVSKFFSRLETQRSYLRTRTAEKEREKEKGKGWPK